MRCQRARTRGASLVCAMSRSGSFRDEPCHHASLCVWRQPCADEDLNLTHLRPEMGLGRLPALERPFDLLFDDEDLSTKTPLKKRDNCFPLSRTTE